MPAQRLTLLYVALPRPTSNPAEEQHEVLAGPFKTAAQQRSALEAARAQGHADAFALGLYDATPRPG